MKNMLRFVRNSILSTCDSLPVSAPVKKIVRLIREKILNEVIEKKEWSCAIHTYRHLCG